MLYSSQFHENFVFHIKENWGVFHMGKTQSVNKNMICYSASKKNHVWRNIIQCNWYKEAANWGQGKMTLGLFNSQRESVNGIIMQCLLSSQRDKNFLNWEVRMCVLDFNLNTLHLKYHLQSVKWTNTCTMDDSVCFEDPTSSGISTVSQNKTMRSLFHHIQCQILWGHMLCLA